jgi:hypothetical protein
MIVPQKKKDHAKWIKEFNIRKLREENRNHKEHL